MLKLFVKFQVAKQRLLDRLAGDKKGENVVGFIALIAIVILFIIIINKLAPNSIRQSVTTVFQRIMNWINGVEDTGS